MKILLSIALWLILANSYAQPNTKVIGKLKDLEKGTVVRMYPLSSSSKKDSVIAGKGKFRFNLHIDEGDIYVLTVGKNVQAPGAVALVYVEPGVVKIKGNKPLLTNAVFSGNSSSKDQTDLNNFIKNAKGLENSGKIASDLSEAMKAKDTVKITVLRKQYQQIDSIRIALYRQWMESHPSSPISAMILGFYARERNMQELQNRLDMLNPEAKQNAIAKRLEYSIEASKITAVGKVAPDFVQDDTLGRPVALKDFRGKYVLVDFWASWCVPCRAENPHVVKAFNDLKGTNFTILSVSLDQPNGKDKWLKAIHDDKLTWNHVSDLKFWDNAVVKQYDINAVPANLLIGPDGKILAKNLRGENLEEKLREFIK